jgi:hypothetical protein
MGKIMNFKVLIRAFYRVLGIVEPALNVPLSYTFSSVSPISIRSRSAMLAWMLRCSRGLQQQHGKAKLNFSHFFMKKV